MRRLFDGRTRAAAATPLVVAVLLIASTTLSASAAVGTPPAATERAEMSPTDLERAGMSPAAPERAGLSPADLERAGISPTDLGRAGMSPAAPERAGMSPTAPGRAEAAAATRVGAMSPRWEWPVTPPRITRPFAAPPAPYASGHRGIDLAAAPDTEVTAPAAGTVRFVGDVVDRPVLTLDHGDGMLSSYEPVASALAIGESVAPGQSVGRVATGGHCAAACLHVGVRVDGVYVSPLLYLDRVPPSVLLPLRPER